jgi:putative ABC transport system ATP-binding protein
MPEKETTKSYDVVIDVQGVERSFNVGKKQIQALGGIDLKIRSTDFLVIFGPSGCGKSTLLNIIAGLDQPTKGRVKIEEIDIFRLGEDERGFFRSKTMSMIHQMPRWIKSLDVIENIALPLIIRGTAEKEALKHALSIMNDLKIEELAKQHPTQLSSGEQQKVALARALVTKPRIILADEPTGNLDSSSSDAMIATFDYLNRTLKRIVILVTHNQAYWSVGSQRIEMRDGRIIKEIENRTNLI